MARLQSYERSSKTICVIMVASTRPARREMPFTLQHRIDRSTKQSVSCTRHHRVSIRPSVPFVDGRLRSDYFVSHFDGRCSTSACVSTLPLSTSARPTLDLLTVRAHQLLQSRQEGWRRHWCIVTLIVSRACPARCAAAAEVALHVGHQRSVGGVIAIAGQSFGDVVDL